MIPVVALFVSWATFLLLRFLDDVCLDRGVFPPLAVPVAALRGVEDLRGGFFWLPLVGG